MRFLPFLSLVILSLSACKRNADSCPSQPTAAVKNLQFRVLDKTTGEDLILSKRLSFDSLVITQECNENQPAKEGFQYHLPDKSGNVFPAFVFGLPGLRNPSLQEPMECFNFYLKWNAQDVDTVRWNYRIDETDECKPQLMGVVVFNGIPVAANYDGVYQYYPLLK